MSYPLHLFSKIVHGELNPVHGSEYLKINIIEELKKPYGTYTERFLVSFESDSSGGFMLKDYQSYAFADLLQFPLSNDEDFENDIEVLNLIKAIAVKELSLRQTDIKEQRCQKSNEMIVLHLEMEHPWSELSEAKAKYHYVNHLLIQEVDKIKADLSQRMFSFSNEEALTSL